MVRLVGNYLITFRIILCVYILTSPFQRYQPQRSDCRTIFDNLGAHTDSNDDDDDDEDNDSSSYINERWKRNASPKHTSNNGTIIVTDSSDVLDSKPKEEQSYDEDNQKVHCDKLSKKSSSDQSESMYCIEYNACPTIESESSERVRVLSCGINLDGSVKVCCSISDRNRLDNQTIPRLATVVQDDEEPNVSTNQSEPETQLTTVIVSDQQQQSASDRTPLNRRQERKKGKMSAGGNYDDINSSIVLNDGYKKFPLNCGKSEPLENMAESRIIGGKVSGKNAWPWFALLMVQRRNSNRFLAECGATLISDSYIITAAHCVLEQGKRTIRAQRLQIRLSEFDMSKRGDGELDVGVSRVIAHPAFNPRTFKNDIALIELNRKLTFNESISPACLPHNQAKIADKNPGSVDNQTVWVIGFGQTSYNGRTSDHLKEAQLRIVQHAKCKRAFSHMVKLTSEYVCASSEASFDSNLDPDSIGSIENSASNQKKRSDSCQGDSGGPLMMPYSIIEKLASTTGSGSSAAINNDHRQYWYLYGIVSFGYKCASPGFPGVYTRVNNYLSWIESHLT